MITINTSFNLSFGGSLQSKELDQYELTALSIWLVEAINVPQTLPLFLNGTKFIWRVEDHFRVKDLDVRKGLLEAREIVDEIEKIPQLFMLDDTYPSWNEHPNHNCPLPVCCRYQVLQFNEGRLGYLDTKKGHRSILPVLLYLRPNKDGWEYAKGKHTESSTVYYEFDIH